MMDQIQYISEEKRLSLQKNLDELKTEKIPSLAKRIDDARQMGDLSENAEYHAAREEMSWAQSQVKEIEFILSNSEIIPHSENSNSVRLSSIVTVKLNGITKKYTIVGAQEADPAKGKISNESPLGQAFFGKKTGDKVQVTVPAGINVYEILDIS